MDGTFFTHPPPPHRIMLRRSSAIMTPNTTPIRRITRASLARFAFSVDGNDEPIEDTTQDTTPDIEDAAIPSRKRKRGSMPTLDDDDDDDNNNIKAEQVAGRPVRARKPAREKMHPQSGTKTTDPPSDWQELYDTARTMRRPGGAASNAAVDTMGCDKLADPTASPRDRRFQTLVALMLSSQTKDTTNAVAMQRLKTELPPHKPGAPPGLTLENMLAVDPETLNELIRVVGFHNMKTKYLKQTAVICRDQWGGDIPDSIQGLVALPGVGPKMAHLCLPEAWGRVEGIGVDVHVHRITNMWGWHATKTPEQTRAWLESWLPKAYWHEINWLLVGLGQTICTPVARKCGDCELGLTGMCKAADKSKVKQGRWKRKGAEEKVEGKGEGKVESKVQGKREAKGKGEVRAESKVKLKVEDG